MEKTGMPYAPITEDDIEDSKGHNEPSDHDLIDEMYDNMHNFDAKIKSLKGSSSFAQFAA